MKIADLLITDALVVNEGNICEADVLVAGGRIEAIGGDLSSRPAKEVIEAAGRHLLPGVIDDHVHFRQPGPTHKGDISSESRAAVAGGTTTFMEMPNTTPATTTAAALEEKHRIAADSSLANFSFYLGATADNIGEIRNLDPQSACGVKVFMGSSTGDMLVDDPATLADIFREAPVPVATHCEDTPTIERNTEAHRLKYGEDAQMSCHPEIRSAEACRISSSMAVSLAREHGTRLHVLHLTTERELALFDSGPVTNKRITAEVCVHHLWFTDDDYDRLGTLIKCNPAIKTNADRSALRRALMEGRIDVVATDHAPHTLDEKQRGYFTAPAGLPSIQHTLPALIDLHREGVLSLELIAERTGHAPAQLFDIRHRGFIREGYWADLALVDLQSPHTVRREDVLHRCGWSPFEGHSFSSSVVATVVSGQLAYHDGVFNEDMRGRRLEFDR